MFINPKIFKKLIKEAWELRVLILSQKEGVLMIQGGYWIVDAQMDVIPYKVRAARQGREMVFINNMLIDAIAPDEVMEGWEDRVTGPTVLYRTLVWKNSAGTAILLPTKLEDDIAENYLRCLEDMEVE